MMSQLQAPAVAAKEAKVSWDLAMALRTCPFDSPNVTAEDIHAHLQPKKRCSPAVRVGLQPSLLAVYSLIWLVTLIVLSLLLGDGDARVRCPHRDAIYLFPSSTASHALSLPQVALPTRPFFPVQPVSADHYN
jgi:hypothetical protein